MDAFDVLLKAAGVVVVAGGGAAALILGHSATWRTNG